jgi:hypothetical protein
MTVAQEHLECLRLRLQADGCEPGEDADESDHSGYNPAQSKVGEVDADGEREDGTALRRAMKARSGPRARHLTCWT